MAPSLGLGPTGGGAPAAPPVVTPPTGPSPTTAPAQEGLRSQARVKLSEAGKLLIEALSVLKEIGSEEGKATLAALKALAPVMPDVEEGLGHSEIQSMLAGAQSVRPAPGGPSSTMLGTPRPQPRFGLMGAGAGASPPQGR